MTYFGALDAVDGERAYTIQSPEPSEIKSFLSNYDHEGSSISLQIIHDEGDRKVFTDDYFNQDVYNKLDQLIHGM